MGHDWNLSYVLYHSISESLVLIPIPAGTGVVNIGRALGHGQILSPHAIWTVALAAGGFVAEIWCE